MSWLLPWALGAAVAAALGVTLLHLLARDRPPRWMLPTARFVAPGTARATRRARTPRDLLLLAVRVLALLLAGAAFAAPVLHPEGGNVAQVLVLDLGDVRSAEAAIDTALVRYRNGDRLVVIDTAARLVAPDAERTALDSLAASWPRGDSRDASPASDGTRSASVTPAVVARPALTAALVVAVRAASRLPQQSDSAALVMIAPALAHDAALAHARATWPGRVTVVAVERGAAADSVERGDPQRLAVRGSAGDAVVAAARLAGATLVRGDAAPGVTGILLVRGEATAGDSAWAARGGTLIAWPGDTAAGLRRMTQPDTVAGIVTEGQVALFNAVRTHLPPAGTAVAHWIDGEPAVTEQAHGAGCIRTAAVAVPAAGDVTLRPAFQAALGALIRACRPAQPQPIADSTRALLAGDGPLARAGALRASSSRSPATPWLLSGALVLLLFAEPLLRRAPASPAGATS